MGRLLRQATHAVELVALRWIGANDLYVWRRWHDDHAVVPPPPTACRPQSSGNGVASAAGEFGSWWRMHAAVVSIDCGGVQLVELTQIGPSIDVAVPGRRISGSSRQRKDPSQTAVLGSA